MRKLITALFLTSTLSVAQAGVHIEPYLGYMLHSSEQKTTTTTALDTTTEYSASSPLLGARLGYGMLGFSFGVDYSMSTGAFELEQDSPATTTPSDKYKSTNLGLYAGFTFPIMLRVWATYFINNKLELDKVGGTAANSDSMELTGNGLAVGVGWTGLPFLALNLEYRMLTFDEIKRRDGTVVALPSTTFGELEAKEIVLSVSLPLDF
jgi:hypothetical protein